MYFFYQYDSRGKIKYKYNKQNNRNEPNVNEYKFDVGLFRVNIKTAKCELVYDFKDVYPISIDDTRMPRVGSVVDENRAVLHYNGTVSILNLNTLQITDSIDVYDKEQFISAEEFPYYLNESCDYVKIDNNTLYYYELDGYSFKLHQYENVSGIKANKWENYIYTHGYGVDINDCYDSTTDLEVDIDFFTKKMEEVNNKKYEEEYQNRPEEDSYIVGGKKYYLDLFGDDLVVFNEGQYIRNEYNEIELNENREVLCTIDEEFLKENSQAFNDLYYLWDKNPSKYEVNNFWVVDEKLYVGVNAHYSWAAQTPSYIYQCDLENNKVYYVGFIDNENRHYVCDLQLH